MVDSRWPEAFPRFETHSRSNLRMLSFRDCGGAQSVFSVLACICVLVAGPWVQLQLPGCWLPPALAQVWLAKHPPVSACCFQAPCAIS